MKALKILAIVVGATAVLVALVLVLLLVAVLVTPWNFPVNIPVEYIAPGLAAGNAIVWVPVSGTDGPAKKFRGDRADRSIRSRHVTVEAHRFSHRLPGDPLQPVGRVVRRDQRGTHGPLRENHGEALHHVLAGPLAPQVVQNPDAGIDVALAEDRVLAALDALGVAHVEAWRAAYRGAMPDEFLDALDPGATITLGIVRGTEELSVTVDFAAA